MYKRKQALHPGGSLVSYSLSQSSCSSTPAVAVGAFSSVAVDGCCTTLDEAAETVATLDDSVVIPLGVAVAELAWPADEVALSGLVPGMV